MSDVDRPAGTVGTFNFIRRIGFPSTIQISSIFLTLVFLSALLAFPSLRLGFADVVAIAIGVIILPSLLGELIVAKILARSSVLDFRRLMGMECLAWGPLLLVLPLSGLMARTGISLFWQQAVVLVLAISLPIRFLTGISLSGNGMASRLLSSEIVPILVMVSLITLYPASLPLYFIVLLVVSILCGVGVARLVIQIDKSGAVHIGAPPMVLFRAFLEHWLNHDPGSLEENLSTLGSTDTIRTSIIAFFGRKEKLKGALVVSSFHPGPYRDLGSGGLPSLLKQHLEEKFGGVVHVPHGISGHQSNIITRADVQKLLRDVEAQYPSKPTTAVASAMARSRVGVATASAQVFDHTALVTLTMSPKDMEDMPLELGEKISRDAGRFGLGVVVVDAHNSMREETFVTPEQSDLLGKAASHAMSALSNGEWLGFKTGFAQDALEDFSLEDGIGPGGVSVFIVSIGIQTVAYITIDGNNMEPGLREEILGSLKDLHVSDGEVMTTDTHLVTGLVRSPLGYYPVGARLEKPLLIDRVRRTVMRAISDLDDSMIGVGHSNVEVRVLGKETFQNVTGYIQQVGRRVRNLFYVLEGASILITLALLALG